MTNTENGLGASAHREQLAELRAQHSATAGEVHKLAQSVSELASEFRRYAQNTGRTNWGVLTGFGTLILAIVALAGSPFTKVQDRHQERLDMQQSALAAISQTRFSSEDAQLSRERVDERFDEARDRESVAVAKLEGKIAVGLERLDDTLQREMRLLDDALQREMRMLLDGPLERLEAVEESITELRTELALRREWISEHDRITSAVNARQDAAIEFNTERIRKNP